MATNRDIARAGIGGKGENERNPMDYYSTPREVTIALIDFLKHEGLIEQSMTVLEPACGEGAISEVLIENGYKVVSSDIRETGYGTGSVDFLDGNRINGIDWVITNPPFLMAHAFIYKCFFMGKRFALLLKSQYWHSARRLNTFRERKPYAVCPLTWRPAFTGNANLMDFLWTVWTEDDCETKYVPLAKPQTNEQIDFWSDLCG